MFSLFYALKNAIQGLIHGTPQKLIVTGYVLVMFGTCFGVVLVQQAGFFNALTIIFYVIALVAVIPAVVKYLAWRQTGLIPLPNNAALLLLDHIVRRETRERPIQGVRETTTYYRTQQAVFTPPAAGSQDVPVICATCQQQVVFRVDSLKARQQRRLRNGLLYGAMILVAIVLGVISSTLALPDWAQTVTRVAFLILFVWGMFGLGILFSYVGVRVAKRPPHHRVRQPERVDLERLQKQVS